jgi:hypothetical protein
MFGVLAEVREAMEVVAGTFDRSALTPEECRRIVDEASRVERLAAGMKAMAGRGARWDGADRSPAHALARATGTSVKEAADALAVADRAPSTPSVDAAVRTGAVSTQQAAAIVGATDDDEKAASLVELAGRVSLGELREECLRVKAASGDRDERARRIRADRRLRTWVDGEGAGNLSMRGPVEEITAITAAIQPLRDELFRAAPQPEPSEAYGFDALVALARGATTKSGGTKVVVRIDWDALLRGWPIDGELSEIAGVGPVPVSAVRSTIESGEALLGVVVTKGVDVVNVAHLQRRSTAYQRTALAWLNPTCCTEGCNAVAHLEIDHEVDWSTSKITLLRWLDKLCTHHHDLKTQRGWALVPGVGKRAMVAPDDPRHPGQIRRARAPAA